MIHVCNCMNTVVREGGVRSLLGRKQRQCSAKTLSSTNDLVVVSTNAVSTYFASKCFAKFLCTNSCVVEQFHCCAPVKHCDASQLGFPHKL